MNLLAHAAGMAGCGRGPEDVDYVNLHGTSTLLNDPHRNERAQVSFDGHAKRDPDVGTKSQVGHPQGQAVQPD